MTFFFALWCRSCKKYSEIFFHLTLCLPAHLSFLCPVWFFLKHSLLGATVGISNANIPCVLEDFTPIWWAEIWPQLFLQCSFFSILYRDSVMDRSSLFLKQGNIMLQDITYRCCKLCWLTWFLQRYLLWHGHLQKPGSYLQAPLWPEAWSEPWEIVLFLVHPGSEDNFYRKESWLVLSLVGDFYRV